MKVRIKRKELNRYFFDKGVHLRIKGGSPDIVLEGEPEEYCNCGGMTSTHYPSVHKELSHPQQIEEIDRDKLFDESEKKAQADGLTKGLDVAISIIVGILREVVKKLNELIKAHNKK